MTVRWAAGQVDEPWPNDRSWELVGSGLRCGLVQCPKPVVDIVSRR
jgi:hypothetical protein